MEGDSEGAPFIGRGAAYALAVLCLLWSVLSVVCLARAQQMLCPVCYEKGKGAKNPS